MCYRFATAILLLAFLMILNRGGHATCDGHANNQTTHDGQLTRGGKTAGNSTVRGPAFLAKRFAIAKRDLLPLGVLGFLFAFCALSLYASFNYMDAGLASTLLFVVLFSTGSESSGYITPFIGVSLWFWAAPWKRGKWAVALMVFVFILSSMSPSDLFPAYVRKEIVQPYALKALPCVIVWFWLIYEMLTKDYQTQTETR